MKEVPITQKMDSIGRIIIPKSIRDSFGLVPGGLVTVKIVVDSEEE